MVRTMPRIRPRAETIIATLPRLRSPLRYPTMPSTMPKGPNRIGMNTKASVPKTIPTIGYMRPGRRLTVGACGSVIATPPGHSIGNLARAGTLGARLLGGEYTVLSVEAGDETLAHGEAKKE